MPVHLLAVSIFAVGTLLITVGIFVIAVLFVIRPDGIPLLSLLSPRERGLRRARRMLAAGDWKAAFALADMLRDPLHPDPAFDQRVRYFEGDCLYQSAEKELQNGKYGEALELMRGAGDRLGLPESEFDKRIVSLLLAEIRRRMATDPTSIEVTRLASELLRVSAAQPEASFWLGLHLLHSKSFDGAVDALQDALADENAPDAALYLGSLHLQAGRPRDALRWLGQAARLAPDNPVIQWQLGEAILESSGDPAAAIKALEKATHPTGLARHVDDPKALWMNTLPPQSWLAQLTRRNRVTCPLGLDRLDIALSAARRSLATALERSNRATDAAAVYYQAFTSGDNSPLVRRGLGLSLARAGLYDDALPHLTAAHARENPPSPLTTGYLAVCTARASSATPEQHAEHLVNGINVLTSLEVRGDAEWARLARELYREVETAGVVMEPRHYQELSLILASVIATDATAIEIYEHLAEVPEQVSHEVAALYVRAASDRNYRGRHDAALFDRAFRDRDGLRRFFAERKWDFATAEKTFLSRWAQRNPGRYPDAPGLIYSAIAERVLIEESRIAEKIGQIDAARAAVDLAFQLGPTRTMTMDRLAEMSYRSGKREEALRYLRDWTQSHPNDPRPLVRRALIIFRDNDVDGALELLAEACDKTSGPGRGHLLLVTARVALSAKQFEIAEELLEQARTVAPTESEPLLALTALAWQRGDYERVASFAALLERVRGNDSQRSFFTALAQSVAGNETLAEAAFATARKDANLAADVAHLRATLLSWQGRDDDARIALQNVTNPTGPSADLINALRGQLAWKSGDYPSAYSAWKNTPAERRTDWQLEQPFAVSAFLSGVQELEAGRANAALPLFHQARSNGLVHPQLPLLVCMAWQRTPNSNHQENETILTQLQQVESTWTPAGLNQSQIAWLARGYRRLMDHSSAHRLLDKVDGSALDIELQRGLLNLATGNLPAAETAFACAESIAPDHPAVLHNLIFTRLSLGQLDGISQLLARGANTASTPEGQRVLTLLRELLSDQPNAEVFESITPADEQRFLKRFQSLGNLAAAQKLLDRLLKARPESPVFRQAYTDLVILRGKQLLDQGKPADVSELATGITNRALSNLLGVAAALCQDDKLAAKHFQEALPAKGDDARVQHNLALTWTRLGDTRRAGSHWQSYLSAFAAHAPAPPGMPDYLYKLGNLVRQRLQQELVPA